MFFLVFFFFLRTVTFVVQGHTCNQLVSGDNACTHVYKCTAHDGNVINRRCTISIIDQQIVNWHSLRNNAVFLSQQADDTFNVDPEMRQFPRLLQFDGRHLSLALGERWHLDGGHHQSHAVADIKPPVSHHNIAREEFP